MLTVKMNFIYFFWWKTLSCLGNL